MRFIEPWQWLKARQKKVERVSRFIDPRVKAGSVDKDGASFGVTIIDDPWASLNKQMKLFGQLLNDTAYNMAEDAYAETELNKWLHTDSSCELFAFVLYECQSSGLSFNDEWEKILKRRRKQFKKEYRRKNEMTPTGKTEVSKELDQAIKATNNWDDFIYHLGNHPRETELKQELLQIYALESKNISGYSAEKCAFVHLRVNGYVIKQDPKYRVILPDLHRVNTGTNWNYVFVSEFGCIKGTDSLDHVHQLTEEQLTKLPSWLKAYAQEVK